MTTSYRAVQRAWQFFTILHSVQEVPRQNDQSNPMLCPLMCTLAIAAQRYWYVLQNLGTNFWQCGILWGCSIQRGTLDCSHKLCSKTLKPVKAIKTPLWGQRSDPGGTMWCFGEPKRKVSDLWQYFWPHKNESGWNDLTASILLSLSVCVMWLNFDLRNRLPVSSSTMVKLNPSIIMK